MNLKLPLFILGLVFGLNTIVQAQRIGYVDTDYILTRVPEYAQAQRQLDNLSKEWEDEISALLQEVDALTQSFNAERVLLTEEMQNERQDEIKKKSKQAKELQRKYFGPDGELFKKRQELVKPLQDQVFTAVQEVAQKRKLDIVLDKAGAITFLYGSDKIDYSDEVLERLGIR
ncbi:MAG: OmpH family outer membrane protein [Schleiferiaceae bacterium]|nr:OmpH family outer membrane protein [Schleiferiaceae bacterium]